MDDNGKPRENVDYPSITGSEDEVEQVDNEVASYLASKPMGVGYDTKSLLEQWRETGVDDDYDPYDDVYEVYGGAVYDRLHGGAVYCRANFICSNGNYMAEQFYLQFMARQFMAGYMAGQFMAG
uniref:Uncharacterized protein n=1 Tax=Tanacetum cinerariifolium TaxID=118510 RepID=A0A699GQA6_TANCI|nr:hypothetical protein [Tanacetum cinerariifolium]